MPLSKEQWIHAFWIHTVRSLLGITKTQARRGRDVRKKASLRNYIWLEKAKFFRDWYVTLWIRFARTLLVRRAMLLLLVPHGRRDAAYLSFDRGIGKITWPW